MTLGTAYNVGGVGSSGSQTISGDLSVDNIKIDGNTVSATTGAVNITPAAGSAIVLDGAVNVDGGVVTGVTTLTASGVISNTDTTNSTSASTGSIVAGGGLGLPKDIYLGGGAGDKAITIDSSDARAQLSFKGAQTGSDGEFVEITCFNDDDSVAAIQAVREGADDAASWDMSVQATGGALALAWRLQSDGRQLLGTTDDEPYNNTGDNPGVAHWPNGRQFIASYQGDCGTWNRTGDDGNVFLINQDGATEGSISVSGSTVSYNAFMGAHDSYMEDTALLNSLEPGDVVATDGRLCELKAITWSEEHLVDAKPGDDVIGSVYKSQTTEKTKVYIEDVKSGDVVIGEGQQWESAGFIKTTKTVKRVIGRVMKNVKENHVKEIGDIINQEVFIRSCLQSEFTPEDGFEFRERVPTLKPKTVSKQQNYEGDTAVGETFIEDGHTKTVIAKTNNRLVNAVECTEKGSKSAYGVFFRKTEGESVNGNVSIAATGLFFVKVKGPCNPGDLVIANGDKARSASPQGDDIVRSNTLAKLVVGFPDAKASETNLVSCQFCNG